MIFIARSSADEQPAAHSAPTTRPTMFVLPADGKEVRKIVFVCDASGSMLNKFASLKHELLRETHTLAGIQSFDIVFMKEAGCDVMNKTLVRADDASRRKAAEFLDNIAPRGETNPIPAIEAAFALKPELIYLLTDGDFPDNQAAIAKIRELNKGQGIKMNTIAFVNESDTDTAFIDLLKQLAHENGGVYTHVNESKLDR
jgi:hypothetical protein